MKEQILDRLARLLKYFKGLEHENNEKEYAYILKGTIKGRLQAVITESRINQDDYFVKCRECGASTMKYFSKQKEAIAAWNRRDGE